MENEKEKNMETTNKSEVKEWLKGVVCQYSPKL